MIECLVSFSTWVEGNSGQIQIFLGIIGFIFIIRSYNKAVQQTKYSMHSIEQAQIQLDHSINLAESSKFNRFLDNKNNALILIVELIERTKRLIAELESLDTQLLLKKLEKVQNNYVDYSKYKNKYSNIAEYIESNLNTLKAIDKSSQEYFESIRNIEYENYHKLDGLMDTVLINKKVLINFEFTISMLKDEIVLLTNPPRS